MSEKKTFYKDIFVKIFKKLQQLMIVLVLIFFGFSSYNKDRREYIFLQKLKPKRLIDDFKLPFCSFLLFIIGTSYSLYILLGA